MAFEYEKLIFNENIKNIQNQISELQKQYLNDLTNGHSIHSLNQSYIRQGWLLNFVQLFDLIKLLAEKNCIQNLSVNQAFLGLKINSASLISSRMGATEGQSNIDLNIIKNLPFFRSIPQEIALILLKKAYVKEFLPENRICQMGTLDRDLFILLDGEAAIFKSSVHVDRANQFMALLRPMSIFGEAGFFLGQPRTADVITTKKSKVLIVPCQEALMDRYLNIEKIQSILERFWLQQAFAKSEMFNQIPNESLDAIISAGQIIDVKAGQYICQQGQQSQSAYIAIQGQLDVFVNNQFVRLMQQGAFFGEISLMMSGGIRTASVAAKSPTKLLEITQESFYALMGGNLHFAREIQRLGQSRLNADQMR